MKMIELAEIYAEEEDYLRVVLQRFVKFLIPFELQIYVADSNLVEAFIRKEVSK